LSLPRLAWLPLLLACAGPTTQTRIDAEPVGATAPWTGLDARVAPGDFKFVVVGDRTGEHRDGVFEQAIAKINLLQPAFVVSVGDLIEGYTQSQEQLDAEWAELEGFVERLEMPFFYAPGNHDFSNEVMSRDWRARFGPSFYHFRYQDVLFLVLNSELFSSMTNRGEAVPGPDTQAAQMAYAEAVLAAQRDARFTFVIVHQPLWDRREAPEDWLRIEEWLGERPYTVFAGHIHRYTLHRRNDRRFVTLATTGGRSRMRGVDHGEFDHVVLVSVGQGEPVIANLMLDGLHGVDVRTAETRRRMTRLERAVSAEPLTGSGVRFRRGVARFELVNKGAGAIEIEARPEAGRDLVPEGGTLVEILPAGASRVLETPVAARTPTRYEELAPATVAWTLRGQKADGAPLELSLTSWLLPEKRFDCPPAPAGVNVDGALEEWKRLPFALDGRPSASAATGASLRFALARDDDFLYLAARVTDPTPFFSTERTAREQDAVQIVLDARRGPERDANESFFQALRNGSLEKLVFASLTPVQTREDPIFSVLLPALPDGTRRAARTTEDGYAVEVAIPRAFLDERQGGPWQSFRLNVSLQDFSVDGGAHVTHAWRPSRFGLSDATPIVGSGTFTRAE
jgi:hypothetical protein